MTAADRYGPAALTEARAAPAHLIVKRFLGMAPPPRVGAPSGWTPAPAAALLMRRPEGWLMATAGGWRAAHAGAGAELDRIVADPAFWSESPHAYPCPDYGASLLLLKVQGRREEVRNGRCPGASSRLVEAALRA